MENNLSMRPAAPFDSSHQLRQSVQAVEAEEDDDDDELLPESEISPEFIEQLTAMGFKREQAVHGLRAFANNFEFTLNNLLRS